MIGQSKIVKRLIILLNLVLIPWIANCQHSVPSDSTNRKCRFSIIAAAAYKSYFGSRYIDYPTNRSTNGENDRFDGFTKIPAFGFRAGFTMNTRIYRHLSFTTGMLCALRKEVYEGNQDTVMKYGTATSAHLILKYDYSYYDIDLPVLVTYRFKRWTLSGGINLPLVSFIKASYTYIPTTSDDLGGKKVNDFKIFRTVFPTLQVSYSIKIKKVTIEPYLGIEIGERSSVCLQGGIGLPFISPQ